MGATIVFFALRKLFFYDNDDNSSDNNAVNGDDYDYDDDKNIDNDDDSDRGDGDVHGDDGDDDMKKDHFQVLYKTRFCVANYKSKAYTGSLPGSL